VAWQRLADIPTPRSEVGAAAIDNTVVVIGGFGGSSVVERYDPSARSWRREPDLPVAVDHPMAAAIAAGPRAGVYVTGGYSNGPPIARTFYLARNATAWREVAPMPEPRGAAAIVAIGERLYVVGGANALGLAVTTLEYDAAADRWSSKAVIPTRRDHLAAAVLDGRACAVGGRELSAARNLPAFECYDPQRDAWERMPAAPTARGGVGAAVVGTRLLFIGGERPEGTFKEVEIFDSATRAWTKGPDLPTPRHGIGVVAVGDTVYVMSGGPTPGGSQTPVCEALTVR
jgi:N-acetylneuraminic acid mutarotase